jgi:ATP-dependent protease ClpP protease subunit
MSQPWYSIRAARVAAGDAPKSAEVYIFGDIGESWWDETVTAKQFVKDFAAIDATDITVRINSYGGSVTDGIAIYNAIKRHPAQITVSIEAAAYSIASLIAMAGDTVEMADNALLMIHAPWGYAVGNSADMRDMADTLDKYAQAMASSYVAKAGMSTDDVLALLTDGQDHWYTAQEALAAGFVDAVAAALPIAASAAIPQAALSRYPSAAGRHPALQPAAPAASTPLETPTMPNPATPQAAAPQPATPEAKQPTAAEVLAADKARRAGVRAEFAVAAKMAGADASTLAKLQQECEDDEHCTAEAAAKKILAAMARDVQPIGATHIETVEDEADKRRDGIVAALLARAGVADAQTRERARASQYRGAKLLDLARASLDRAGIKHGHMDQMQLVGAAFTQGTSDFPILLENAMHKTLQQAYATAPDTWSRFCAVGTVTDFRDHPRYRVGSLGNLEALNELGEFRNKSIPDGERAKVRAGTKGNVINLSRQAIINDDLGAFIGLAAAAGRASKRTVEADVYAMLALNSGAGPTMEDGKALFHADHGNLTTAAALSMAALDLDRVAMASQTDVGGNDFLDLRPAVLLVPLALGGSARVINGAQYDPDTANKLQRPNMVNGLFRDIVDTPRLSGTRRYLFADPAEAPVLEVVFLDGNDTPYVESENGFSVDGTRWKVRLDFGVGAVDYRGAVMNAGG